MLMNIDIKRGNLCDDAQVFMTRSGRPKLSFRLRVPRSRSLPQKVPANADFFSVVAYGDRYVDLAPLLTAGTEVLTFGTTQSRDMEDGSVVTEILAREIVVFPQAPDLNELLGAQGEDREGPLVTLAWFLASEWDIARRQERGGPGQWPVEDLSRWIAERLQSHLGSKSAQGDRDGPTGD
jgi:single-stranded DNA-binding protein